MTLPCHHVFGYQDERHLQGMTLEGAGRKILPAMGMRAQIAEVPVIISFSCSCDQPLFALPPTFFAE